MKLGEIVLEGKQAPEYAVIYIIRDEEGELLYIGQSFGVEHRLAQHLGYDDPPSNGYFDEFARASIPACWNWDIDFIVLPEDILNSANTVVVKYWIRNNEAKLIRELQPKYNIQYRYK